MKNLTVQLVERGLLSEASKSGSQWRIKIIEGDRQGSSAYYPKEALEKGKHLFKKGTKIYLNHPSSEDKWSQPERRVQDIIGYLSEDAEFDGKDLFANATFLESAKDLIKERAEADLIAMSIRAEGTMVETSKGLELAEFTTVHSVDVVTVGGAGGGFEKLLESARNENNKSVAEAQEEETELELPKEFLESLDELTKGMNALQEALKAEADAKVEAARKLEEAAKPEEKQGPSAAEIASALVEAKLSDKARGRVLAAVESGTDLTEAIKAEKEIAAEYLAEAGKSGGAGHVEEEGNLTEAQKLESAFGSVFSS